MHSGIFGIMKQDEANEIIKKGEELKLPFYTFEENLPHFADYVRETDDFEDDFEWFVECLKCYSSNIIVNKEKHTIKILKNFKYDFFKDRFEKIKAFFNSEKSFDTFCGVTKEGESKYRIDADLYEIQRGIEDEFSFYASDNEGFYQTIDSFIRLAEENVEYVIFDSIDYHY